MIAPGEIERIRGALVHVPADNRDVWIRMAMAVKSAIGEEGFELWDTWSQQASSYNASDARAVWKGIRADGKITLGSLFHAAQINGWCDDRNRERRSAAELEALKRAAADRAIEEEAKRERMHAKAAVTSRALWKASTPAANENP